MLSGSDGKPPSELARRRLDMLMSDSLSDTDAVGPAPQACVLSVVFGFDFKIGLRMRAYGANGGCFLAYHDVTAVHALPDGVLVA